MARQGAILLLCCLCAGALGWRPDLDNVVFDEAPTTSTPDSASLLHDSASLLRFRVGGIQHVEQQDKAIGTKSGYEGGGNPDAGGGDAGGQQTGGGGRTSGANATALDARGPNGDGALGREQKEPGWANCSDGFFPPSVRLPQSHAWQMQLVTNAPLRCSSASTGARADRNAPPYDRIAALCDALQFAPTIGGGATLGLGHAPPRAACGAGTAAGGGGGGGGGGGTAAAAAAAAAAAERLCAAGLLQHVDGPGAHWPDARLVLRGHRQPTSRTQPSCHMSKRELKR